MALSSKYIELHKDPIGPGDRRPTALQVIQDEGLVDKLRDKTILITGFSSGLGIETARALAKTGARLYLTVRNMAKGATVLEDMAKKDPTLDIGQMKLIQLELSSLHSVREAAQAFQAESSKLHILINNAGIAMTPHVVTSDGFEQQFQVNHLSHFLLFQLLKPMLLDSSMPDFQSRVICVSSIAHRFSSVLFDDHNQNINGYNPMVGYGQSKTCNIWMANHIERLYGHQGLHALSLHPGGIYTGLLDSHSDEVRVQMDEAMKLEEVAKVLKDAGQGSATTVLAAIGREFEGKGGIYLEDCRESIPYDPSTGMVGIGYSEWAFNPEGEERLWKDSLRLVGCDSSNEKESRASQNSASAPTILI